MSTSERCVFTPSASTTSITIFHVPARVGVPTNVPVERLKRMPRGSDPRLTRMLVGRMPPASATLRLKKRPTSPGRRRVLTIESRSATMTRAG